MKKIKIRLPITDKFLRDVFNLMEKMDEATPDVFALKTIKEAFCPDLYKLRRKHKRELNRRQFANLIYYLKRNGYIRLKKLESKKAVILTPKGVQKALSSRKKTCDFQKRTDRKWQVVFFDIPEEKRRARDLLRMGLQDLGYKMFQKSIWISPYDVLEKTRELIQRLRVDSQVRILLVEEIEF